MEELDNLVEHDEDTSDEYDLSQENDAHFEVPTRMHLKRRCQVKKNFDLGRDNKENLGDTNYSLEKSLSCLKCPFKCQTTEELEKHDRFYHQKWPIATECQNKTPSSSNQNHKELLNNSQEIDMKDNFEIENNENFEDCIDQAMNSDDFDLMDKNWNENHTISKKENDATSNSCQEGTNQKISILCL